MKPSWKLGRVFGIDLYVHMTFLIVPAWVLFATIDAGLWAAAISVLFTLAVFGCVILHELGHALMARYFGIGTHDITISPIGGLARLERMPRKPVQELLVALAGPAVNVVIAIVLAMLLVPWLTLSQIQSLQMTGAGFFVTLLLANVLLVVFNLLPAFPMDGGRVLRSILAMVIPYNRATLIAARLGQVMAVLFGIAGIVTLQLGLILIALFVFFFAWSEVRNVRNGLPLPSTLPERAVAPVDENPTDAGIQFLDPRPAPVDPRDNDGIFYVRQYR